MILGIDGGSFTQINTLLKKNALPNFKKIIEKGYSATLKVTIPPITVPSWPCLFSGITPSQLGFNYFSVRGKGLFNSSHWRDRAIFSNPSLKSFVLNVPGTYPAWKIKGEMITGLMSPKLSTYPKELEERYIKNWIISGRTVKEVFQASNMKQEILISNLNENFDLMVFVITIPDHISHLAGISLKNALNYIDLGYKKIDKFLGKILDSGEIDNLFIISDHGLTKYKKIFYFHNWINKKGFFHLSYESKKKLWKNIFLKLYGLVNFFFKPNDKMIRLYTKFLDKLNETKESSTSLQKKKPRKPRASFVVPDVMRFVSFKSNVGGLYLYGKYKQTKEKIIAELKKEKYVKKVITPEVELFPDLYIILDERYFFSIEPSLFLTRKTSLLIHSLNGLFIAYGKDIKQGKTDSVHYFDVAPTILKSFNFKKQDGMIGEPMKIFKLNKKNYKLKQKNGKI